MNDLNYTGEHQDKLSEPYLPSPALVKAVNVAIALERPLLLKGEPGCGKTRLAKAVAEELGLKYFPWPVKSISHAREGLYTYDTIGRLRDAQLAAHNFINPEQRAKFDKPAAYVKLGPLGQAFRHKQKAVVLIDEIDKADIDFPNDLLQELDEQEFTITETSKPIPIKAKHRPIIFITSNDEKELPDAFLRRCIFFYIDFPDQDTLRKIVSYHLKRLDMAAEEDDPLLVKAVELFWTLRGRIEQEKQYSGKKVSTSELIDWVKILKFSNIDANDVELTKELLFPSELPFPGVLFKNKDDIDVYVDKPKTEETKVS